MSRAEQSRVEIGLLDVLKFIASILVAGSHMLPLFPWHNWNLYYGQWFFRWCVPFFYISTGYFYSGCTIEKKKTYIKRVGMLYLFGLTLYIPQIIGSSFSQGIGGFLRNLYNGFLIGYHHLWYLSALLITLSLWFLISKSPILSTWLNRLSILIVVFLIFVGAFFDEYIYLVDYPWLASVHKIINWFGGTRHAIFFAVPMVIIGKILRERREAILKVETRTYLAILLVVLVISFLECRFLFQNVGESITNDVSLFGYLPGVILFILSIKVRIPMSNRLGVFLRKLSEFIYIVHLLVLTNVKNYMGITGIPLLIATIVLCMGIYLSLHMIIKK